MSPLAPSSSSATANRLYGVDLARAVALIGMLMVHFGPKGGTDLLGRLYALPHGRASVLFVLVAGIGVAFLSRRVDSRADARLRLFCFALVLLPLGLMLEALRHPVAVILHHYAGYFLFAIAVIGLPTRWLLRLAVLASLAGPLLFFAGRLALPAVFNRHSVQLGDTPLEVLWALLFTGPYPLVVWAAPLLWGLWIGRQDLHAPRLRRQLMLVGAAVAIAAVFASELLFAGFGEPRTPADWRFAFADTAHSQMPLWLLGAIGSAALVVGLALTAAARWPDLARRGAVLGQMALSIYVLHILVLWAAPTLVRHDDPALALLSVFGFALLAWLLATAWRRWQPRGPLEQLMHGFATGVATLGQGPESPAGHRPGNERPATPAA